MQSFRQIGRQIVTKARHDGQPTGRPSFAQDRVEGLVCLAEAVFLSHDEPRTNATSNPVREREVMRVRREGRSDRYGGTHIRKLFTKRQFKRDTGVPGDPCRRPTVRQRTSGMRVKGCLCYRPRSDRSIWVVRKPRTAGLNLPGTSR